VHTFYIPTIKEYELLFARIKATMLEMISKCEFYRAEMKKKKIGSEIPCFENFKSLFIPNSNTNVRVSDI